MLHTGSAHESFLSKLEALDSIANANPHLIEKQFVFYLTGSQFFSGTGNDFDYFVQYSEYLENALTQLGFARISKRCYGDSLCVAVMRWMGVSYQIDVQLVSNAGLKLKVQDIFLNIGKHAPTKEEWDLAFQLLK